jgi:prolyl-tRNA editing enzyme YbaK/EbsC (Cys-tRNA(Pro) deacylase)
MRPSQHPIALRVQKALGPSFAVVEFEQTTHTAADAAAAIGCDVAQIAKSILFRAAASAKPVMVVASGSNRVDDKKIRALLGEKIEQASPEFVKEMTGFEVGGVPPVAHAHAVTVFIDQDLAGYPTLWAAGGTPNAVFEISFDDLVRLTGATVADVAKLQAVLP